MKKITLEQYLAFVLIFAAYADNELKSEELAEILECIEIDVFKEVRAYFLTLSENERVDIIRAYKDEYLGTDEMKEAALKEIRDVLHSDQRFLPMEQGFYNFLKKEIEE